MKERGIIMQASSVKAILEDRKTMTRRIIQPPRGWKRQGLGVQDFDASGFWNCYRRSDGGMHWQYSDEVLPQNYQVGQRLWVRETWTQDERGGQDEQGRDAVYYRADMPEGVWEGYWRASIFMPRWASRITLEVTDVRVERLWDISEEDAKAEGVQMVARIPEPPNWWGYKQEFEYLWKELHGEKSWAVNPFVWVIQFRRIV